MTLLSLEQFRNALHYNPFHFWGWANAKVPVTSTCNTVVKQYAWQMANALGRAEILLAIEEAENRLRDYLGYSVAPRFIAEEIKNYPDAYDKMFRARYPIDARGDWKPVVLGEGYIQGLGIEKLTKIATVNIVNDAAPAFPYHSALPAAPYLVYLDTDGDGLADTFNLQVATSVTDASQIAVYFSATDRLNSDPVGDKYKIQPVSVSISGGKVTVIGRSWMLARPILYEGVGSSGGLAPANLDPDTVSNYAQSLDVYQRTCDATGTTIDTAQGKFIWESLPYPMWWGTSVSNGSTDSNSQAYSVTRVGIRNAKAGVVIPGEAILDASTGFWNATLPPWSSLIRPPDRVLIRYLAGYPLDSDYQMNRKFQTIVFRLAAAQLDNRISACDEAMRELFRWQRDMSQVMDRTEGYRISNEDLNNPFGVRRGAVDAWKQTKYLRLLRGITNN